MLSYGEASKAFSSLLDWHLAKGTRPSGDKKVGIAWKNAEFARALKADFTPKAVLTWRTGRHHPRVLDHIEHALFGDSETDKYAPWRNDLRVAYAGARSGEVPSNNTSVTTQTGATIQTPTAPNSDTRLSPRARDAKRRQRNEAIKDRVLKMPHVRGAFIMQLQDHTDDGYLLSVTFDDAATSASQVLKSLRSAFEEEFPDVPYWGQMLTESDDTVGFGFAYLDDRKDR